MMPDGRAPKPAAAPAAADASFGVEQVGKRTRVTGHDRPSLLTQPIARNHYHQGQQN
jgi:hypothetical protein